MKTKSTTIAILSCVAMGLAGLSSCSFLQKVGGVVEGVGLNPFEPTDDYPARVVQASVPTYTEGGQHVMGKGKGEVKTTAHWNQKITVVTEDGQQFSGTITPDTRDGCVRTGSSGVAKVTRRSKILRDFQASY